uniref:Uncharacterized protein n=1 Tax=Panagrolaimus sp. JU765 TaxID=591449 RepID=A0AC34QDZ8_9BILA
MFSFLQYKKLSKEAAEAVKTIRELKKKEKAAFESIPKSERKEAGFVINAVAPRDLVERPHLKSKKA